jgi:hypothetical protein
VKKNLLLSMGWLLQCHAHCTSTPNPKIACVWTYVPFDPKMTTQMDDICSEIIVIDYLSH